MLQKHVFEQKRGFNIFYNTTFCVGGKCHKRKIMIVAHTSIIPRQTSS